MRLEGFASDCATADGHRVRDGPRVLGWREASEAAVEDQTAADEVDDRACARLLREPIVRFVAHVDPDARAGREELGPDELELVVVGVAARFERARLPRSQSRRPLSEQCAELRGLVREPRVAHEDVQLLRESLE